MNPLSWCVRLSTAAVITGMAAAYLLTRKTGTGEDLLAGAAHFRRGLDEFRKGVTAMVWGEERPSPQAHQEARERGRITIE
ncbi:MAG: hypothetical protein AB1646_18945 [Thermodesulfobacteriota bacterium]